MTCRREESSSNTGSTDSFTRELTGVGSGNQETRYYWICVTWWIRKVELLKFVLYWSAWGNTHGAAALRIVSTAFCRSRWLSRESDSTCVFVCNLGSFSPFLLATQAFRVSKGIALIFSRTFGTRWGWRGLPHSPAFSTLGKNPVPIVQEAGWVSGPVWTGGKSRPHRDSIPDRPARSQSLYRLSYPAIFFSIFCVKNGVP